MSKMRFILILIVSITATTCAAQSDSLIKAPGDAHDTLITRSGYKIYIGQRLKTGAGSTPDGDFRFIRRNSGSLLNYTSKTGRNDLANQANAFPRGNAGLSFEIIRIEKRGNDRMGYVYYPILGGFVRYEVDINNAIASGEIDVPEEYRPRQKSVQVLSTLSVADELLKLKKLRDDSLLTEDEFQAQRKKLLEK